ncbi:MAG: hypothetical protein ACHQ7M_11805 [Chloroflexota bacterium]
MQHEPNELDLLSSEEKAKEPAETMTEADVQHLLAEANRTWDVLEHDLGKYHHHPAA